MVKLQIWSQMFLVGTYTLIKGVLKVQKIELEKKANKVVTSICCQTDQHPDIPYQITTPLPPIFNSMLCHKSKPIRFLSKSLPSLDCICWVKPPDENE